MGATDQGRSGIAATVRELVEPVVSERGLEVFDVELASPVLRVLVDRAGGVDLDTLSEVTRAVSALLDEHDPVPGRYTLEVSSPGVERPLRLPRHFEGAVGSAVAVKTVPGYDGERRLDGTLAAADQAGVTLALADGGEVRLSYDDIAKARTVFEWGPAPKPGGKGQKRQKRSARPAPAKQTDQQQKKRATTA
jgi:ribosome maturation factor RimP